MQQVKTLLFLAALALCGCAGTGYYGAPMMYDAPMPYDDFSGQTPIPNAGVICMPNGQFAPYNDGMIYGPNGHMTMMIGN